MRNNQKRKINAIKILVNKGIICGKYLYFQSKDDQVELKIVNRRVFELHGKIQSR